MASSTKDEDEIFINTDMNTLFFWLHTERPLPCLRFQMYDNTCFIVIPKEKRDMSKEKLLETFSTGTLRIKFVEKI